MPSYRTVLALLAPWASLPGTPTIADERLEQIVITATPLRSSASDTAQPVDVLADEALVLARQASLGDSLAMRPGISASSFGPFSSRPILRGQGGLRIQVYQDGADALDASALSEDHAVGLELLSVERIEIVRGPAALLFGNAAAAGAVNVVTRRLAPLANTAARVELIGDSAAGERALGAQVQGSLGSLWRWSGELHHLTRHDLDTPAGRLAFSNGATRGAAVGLGGVFDRTEFAVSLTDYHSDYGLPASEGVRLVMHPQRTDLSLTHVFEQPGLQTLRWRIALNDYTHEEIEEDGAIGTTYAQRGLDSRLSLDIGAPGRPGRGTLGLHWRELDFSAVGEEAFLPPSLTRNVGLFAFFAQPLGTLALELGARVERQHVSSPSSDPRAAERVYDDGGLTGSIGLRGPWLAGWSWSIQGTSTARHPTATELFAEGPHLALGRYEIGTADLGIETARTLDVGLHHDGGADGWRGSLQLFVADYRNFVAAQPTGLVDDDERLPIVRFAAIDARFTGAELEWARERLWTAAIGDLGVRLWGDLVRARERAGAPLPQIPPYRLGSEVVLSRGAWRAAMEATWHDAQRRVAATERPTAGFTWVEFSLAYRQRAGRADMLWFARGSNLLDETARRHASPLKDVAPLAGRNLRLGVQIRW